MINRDIKIAIILPTPCKPPTINSSLTQQETRNIHSPNLTLVPWGWKRKLRFNHPRPICLRWHEVHFYMAGNKCFSRKHGGTCRSAGESASAIICSVYSYSSRSVTCPCWIFFPQQLARWVLSSFIRWGKDSERFSGCSAQWVLSASPSSTFLFISQYMLPSSWL